MFEIFSQLYQILLFQPIFNLLVLFYLPFKNLGVAIFILTLVIKGLLTPLDLKNLKFQKIIADIQPKILEIQKKYKNDQKKQVEEMTKVYKSNKFNPLSGFLPLLIQMPIFIAIFQIFQSDLNSLISNSLYSFMPQISQIDTIFLGINLATPNLVLAGLTAVSQFFQTKFLAKKTIPQSQTKEASMQTMVQKQMAYIFPVITFFILNKLPAALGMYWLAITIFTILQQYFVFKKTYNHAGK